MSTAFKGGKVLAAGVGGICGIALLAALVQAGSTAAREQSAQAVRASVLDAAMQCCAIEGSYPSSLAYLEKHYGLSVNREDFAITYESFAANVVPSVRVVPR